MISVEQLSVEFSAKPLFDNISFQVNPKDKIALVGKNGAGKSTMLKIFAGLQQPTSGRLSVPKGVVIGYLPQHMLYNDGVTVREEAEKAFDGIKQQQKLIDRLTTEMSERTDYESKDYMDLIDTLTHESEKLNMMGGADYEAELEKTLMGLGFTREDFDRQTTEFSGGWRMRIEIAKILLSKPDVLLLDEPTNHLDIESIQWFENFLSTTSAAVILVSHDKAFINHVTNRTIEISLGKIYDYKVPYDKYLELRKERREQQIRAYENQKKMIEDTEDFIEKFRYKATKAVQVQSRIKQLAKIERLEVDMEDTSCLNLRFPPAPRSGQIPVEVEGLTKKYDDKTILQDIGLIINRGEKVAFVGKNGEGKSTLVKCIMGEISDYTGKLKLGHNVQIGYFAQNQASLLDGEVTVFDTIDRVAVGDIRTKIRDILGAFMFGGEASDKKVKVLSGGERSRLAMIKLLLEPVNLLILDEPTNHLDIPSKEVLKQAIKDFDGTAIIVSHDRDFLDGLVDKVYEFSNKKVREHLGGIYDFLRKKQIDSLAELNKTVAEKEVKATEPVVEERSSNQISYEARKELNRKIRKAERSMEEAEKAVEKIEAEIAEMEEMLQKPENVADGTLFQKYEAKKHELEQKMYEWEILGEETEQLKTQLD
ncbi:MAG: ABC-F family ATP-binding cassette domain-containing protein [Paludibacteraceae bacterium]|nr:ABC-F family ATP-binding cassette domain-containing protein [Paludibacteraceae bacterium]